MDIQIFIRLDIQFHFIAFNLLFFIYKQRISADYNFYSWTSIDELTLREIEF